VSVSEYLQPTPQSRQRSPNVPRTRLPGSFPICNTRNPSPRQPLATYGVDPPRDTTCPDADIKAMELPPRAIGLGLLEIYFERIYNAELLFRKATLFQDYLNGSVAPYLLRAIFAMATLFLEDPQSEGFHAPPELTLLRTYASSGNNWAAEAAKQVLPQSMHPSIHTVQALSCLGLYSFAKSDMPRAKLYCTMAYTCCSYLPGLVVQDTTDTNGLISCSPSNEGRRRALWACWASLCVAALPEAYAKILGMR